MQEKSRDRIRIHCDGACSGNQFHKNVGGWAAMLQYGDRVKTVSGSEYDTTNQRMELTACIKGLEEIKVANIGIDVYSDSAYLVNCFNDRWYEKWQRNGWRNKKNEPVENRDLWQRLLQLVSKYEVKFHKVGGHSGNALNEMVDRLAREAIKRADPGG